MKITRQQLNVWLPIPILLVLVGIVLVKKHMDYVDPLAVQQRQNEERRGVSPQADPAAEERRATADAQRAEEVRASSATPKTPERNLAVVFEGSPDPKPENVLRFKNLLDTIAARFPGTSREHIADAAVFTLNKAKSDGLPLDLLTILRGFDAASDGVQKFSFDDTVAAWYMLTLKQFK